MLISKHCPSRALHVWGFCIPVKTVTVVTATLTAEHSPHRQGFKCRVSDEAPQSEKSKSLPFQST